MRPKVSVLTATPCTDIYAQMMPSPKQQAADAMGRGPPPLKPRLATTRPATTTSFGDRPSNASRNLVPADTIRSEPAPELLWISNNQITRQTRPSHILSFQASKASCSILTSNRPTTQANPPCLSLAATPPKPPARPLKPQRQPPPPEVCSANAPPPPRRSPLTPAPVARASSIAARTLPSPPHAKGSLAPRLLNGMPTRRVSKLERL